MYVYLGFQEYFGFEQMFYLQVGFGVDFFQVGVVFVDYDGFLVFMFDLDYCIDVQQVVVFGEVFDFDSGGVWQFFVELVYQLFMYQFIGQEMLVVVGDFVFVEYWWGFWQQFQYVVYQCFQVVVFLCGDWMYGGEVVIFGYLLQEWQ